MVAFGIVAAQAVLNSYQKVKRFYAPILLLRVRRRALLDKVKTLHGRMQGRNTYMDYADVGDGDIRAAHYSEEEPGARLRCVKDFAEDSANITRPCMYWIVFIRFAVCFCTDVFSTAYSRFSGSTSYLEFCGFLWNSLGFSKPSFQSWDPWNELPFADYELIRQLVELCPWS